MRVAMRSGCRRVRAASTIVARAPAAVTATSAAVRSFAARTQARTPLVASSMMLRGSGVTLAGGRGFASAPANVPPPPAGHIHFNLADIGEGIAECELMEWFVKPGDAITEFGKVCKVQSDKATVEITSRYSGTVTELFCEVGKMAKVGHPLITIKLAPGSAAPTAAPAAAAAASPAAAAAASPSVVSSGASAAASAKALASPAVRRLAREHGVDLAQLIATGPKSNITKGDVLAFIAAPTSAAPSATGAPAAAAGKPAAAVAAPVAVRSTAPLPDKTIPVTGIQRIMVQTMTAASAVPTLGYSDEIVMDQLIKLRSQMKSYAESQGVKLTYMPFLIKATSMALLKYPSLNAHVNADCTAVTHKGSHNIGLAMDTPRGLLVPNVKNVQNLSILEIGRELQRLTQAGNEARLTREDLTGGTYTISNIGTIGGTYTRPILVVPEVVITALGKFQVLPRYNSKMEVVPTTIMVSSWAADHRVVDGATIARFGNQWKAYLENPAMMLLDTK